MKICDIFLIFAQNIDHGYEVSALILSEAVLTSTHNLCFKAKLRKREMYTPVNPSHKFTKYKSGV